MTSRLHTQKVVWVHGASLGDVNALFGLVESLSSRGCSLYLSATTSSGRARWSYLFPEHPLRDPPLFLPHTARKVFEQCRPEFLILELLEIWPAWVTTWARLGVKVVVVDGRISTRTLWAKFLLFKSFSYLTLFLAQTQVDADRAEYLGVDPECLVVCGDAKLDSLIARRPAVDHHANIYSPSAQILKNTIKLNGKLLIILGCVRPRDEIPALRALRITSSSLKDAMILIAPRHLERVPSIARRARKQNLKMTYYSEMTQTSQSDLIILDQYGELSDLYHFAHVAIIGGTFYDRGQNLMEAALAHCAVIHGPKVSTIRVQRDTIAGSGGYEVSSWLSAFKLGSQLLSQAQEVIGVPSQSISRLRGALKRQLTYLDSLIFDT